MRTLTLTTLCLLLLPIHVDAQTARTILENSFRAHNPTRRVIADIVATGTLAMPGGITEPMTAYSKGIGMSRFDYPQSGRRAVAAAGAAWRGRETDLKSIPAHAATRSAPIFPILDLMVALDTPSAVLTYAGVYQLGNQPAHRVRVHIPDAAKEIRLLKRPLDDEFDVYIDAATMLVLRSEHWPRTEENIDLRVPNVLNFSDYRSVAGVILPFTTVSTIGSARLGMHHFQYAFSEIRFNQGLADSLFAVDGGRQ